MCYEYKHQTLKDVISTHRLRSIICSRYKVRLLIAAICNVEYVNYGLLRCSETAAWNKIMVTQARNTHVFTSTLISSTAIFFRGIGIYLRFHFVHFFLPVLWTEFSTATLWKNLFEKFAKYFRIFSIYLYHRQLLIHVPHCFVDFCLNAESISWCIWTRDGSACPLGLPRAHNIDPWPNFVLRFRQRYTSHLESNQIHRSTLFSSSGQGLG